MSKSKSRHLAELISSSGALKADKVADDSVDSAHIKDGSVDDVHITNVSSSKLTGTVTVDASSPHLTVNDTQPRVRLSDDRASTAWTSGKGLGGIEWWTADGDYKVAGVDVVAGGSSVYSPDGVLVFSTGDNNDPALERMRIDGSGKVGIGNTSPTEKLDVTGTVKATSFEGDGSSLTGIAAFPSGTKMLFQQTSAPTGWTKSTTHNNKALRVVSGTAGSGGSSAFTTAFGSPSVSGSVNLSGSLASGNLSVSMSGNVYTNNTTLSTNTMPSHSHTVKRVGNNQFSASSNNSYNGQFLRNFNGSNGQANHNSGSYTANKGNNGAHSHGAGHNLSGNLNGSPSTGNLSGSLSSATAGINVQYVDLIIAAKD